VCDVAVSRDLVEQMFPRLDQLILIHRTLLRGFIDRQRLRHDRGIDDVGDLLVKRVCVGLSSVCCTSHQQYNTIQYNIRYPGTLTLSPERQSAQMSKITNDVLTRSGTRCFIAVLT